MRLKIDLFTLYSSSILNNSMDEDILREIRDIARQLQDLSIRLGEINLRVHDNRNMRDVSPRRIRAWIDAESDDDLQEEGLSRGPMVCLDRPLNSDPNVPIGSEEWLATHGDSIHDPTLTKAQLDAELDQMVADRQRYLATHNNG